MKKNTLKNYAFRLVTSKTKHGGAHDDYIKSIGTEERFKPCMSEYLEWRSHSSLPIYGPHWRAEMIEYLSDQSEVLSQKALDQHRQGLQKVFSVQLTRFVSMQIATLTAKDFTKSEIQSILDVSTPRVCLSTRLCLDAGLRASELLSLKDVSKQPISVRRSWRSDLYVHRCEHVMFSVHGKGGLIRGVALSQAIAAELEEYRLDIPKESCDRGIIRLSNFDLLGGQSFSQSFSVACKQALGQSVGAHGLRHCWAKNRLSQLLKAGVKYAEAFEIVSQESGHFRPSITLAYLYSAQVSQA